MKRTKKIVTLAMAAVLLVCTTVAATLAYLQSTTETVTNTFTVGNVEITLDEALVTLYGKPAIGAADTEDKDGDNDTTEIIPTTEVSTVAEATRVIKNDYKLLPGHEYVKDPTVHVAANSEESYIRMIVTISDLEDVKAVLGVDATAQKFLPQYFVEGWDDKVWITTGVITEKDNTATYEFRYYKTVNTLDGKVLNLEPLFTDIVVPKDIDNDSLAKLKDLEIKVVAHAIQKDGFDSADEAWAEFVDN